jgi:hypothetical protein
MAKFEIAFQDGTKVVKEASTADEAKAVAKHERRSKLPRDTPGSASEVKVTSITRLQDRDGAARPSALRDIDQDREARDRERNDRERDDRERETRERENRGE